MSDTLDGKSLLITGGAGAFGQAFAKRALATGARRVVIFSRSESRQAEMRAKMSDPRLRWFVGDIREEQRLIQAMREIDYCIHAAALKRVETAEANPGEAVATNVLGTEYVARACVATGVTRAVFLSTDKAAAPNTLYGATKLTAERLWCGWNAYSPEGTAFFSTRYGNVCNSTGSVIPIWQEQMKTGRITVTDPTATRFWMSMQQAVELVETALEVAGRGEVLVPKIGAASLEVLAQAVAPGAEQRITKLGLSEKQHETLVSEDEARRVVDIGSCYSILPAEAPWTDEPDMSVRVPSGFTYRSDTARQLSTAQLREMIA